MALHRTNSVAERIYTKPLVFANTLSKKKHKKKKTTRAYEYIFLTEKRKRGKTISSSL